LHWYQALEIIGFKHHGFNSSFNLLAKGICGNDSRSTAAQSRSRYAHRLLLFLHHLLAPVLILQLVLLRKLIQRPLLRRLRTLVQATGVSERTVEYAFREQYSLTRQAYMSTNRLHLARRRLGRGSLGAATVGAEVNAVYYATASCEAVSRTDRFNIKRRYRLTKGLGELSLVLVVDEYSCSGLGQKSQYHKRESCNQFDYHWHLQQSTAATVDHLPTRQRKTGHGS